MDYAILGGDARNAYLTRMLCANGCDARWIDGFDCGVPGVPRGVREELGEARAAVLNWPYPGDGEILSRLPSGAQVYFCGPAAPDGISRRLRSVNLWADEQLLAENAWLTAEGAISAAMAAGDASLRECACLVVGWGRIGRALTEMLVGLSARVTVASRSERGRNGAVMRGAQSVATEEIAEALPGKKRPGGAGARRPGRAHRRSGQPALRRGSGGGAGAESAGVARAEAAGTLLSLQRRAGTDARHFSSGRRNLP